MSLKIKKSIPLIDQHDKNGMWGGKFGGNFVPETLKKPIEDLTNFFQNLEKIKVLLEKETIISKIMLVRQHLLLN